ncbi:MAG TPA: ImcF-related family protein, partial [Acidobacteriaceae bacterium]|nr:ImcF-related family protein [Acidobacteriaceae bacterium]
RRLTDLFNRLYQSLADKRTVLLSREEDPGKRALAYEFPRELKKLRGDVVQFLLDVFRPATLAPHSHLRGFYFCGRRMVPRGRVEVDLTFSSNSVVRRPSEATVFFESRGASAAPDQSVFAKRAGASTVPRWSFLLELFREIVLVDPAGDVVPAVRGTEHRVRDWALAAAGALCLLLTILWANAWRNNHDLLDHVRTAVDTVSYGPPTSQPQAMGQLESMRPVLERLHADARNAPPLSFRWGLYAGEPARIALDQLYFGRFRQAMLDPVLAEIAARLLALQPGTPAGEDVTALVKSYRAMTSRACAPDDAVLSATVLPLWGTTASPDPEVASLALKQFSFYLTELKLADPYAALGASLHENHEAVRRAQTYLQGINGPEKILGALVTQIDGQQPSEKLSAYAGDFPQVMSGPNELEAAYTSHGWTSMQDDLRNHKLIATGDPCVVGSSGGVATWNADEATQGQLDRLYADTYTQQWKQFLAAHHVLPFSGAADASQKLRVLADNNRSPLLGLIYMTSSNTNVAEPQTVTDRVSTSLRDAAQGTKTKFKNLVGSLGSKGDAAAQPDTTNLSSPPPATVMNEFAPVHAMVDPGAREKWLNDKNQAYVKSLEEMSTALAALPPRVDSTSQTDMQALAQADAAVTNATMALHTLEGLFPNTSSGVDVELKALLQEPITYAGRVVREVVVVKPTVAAGGPVTPVAPPPGPSPHDMARAVIEAINRQARDLCGAVNTLHTKYPFDVTAAQDASLDEVDGIFGAGNGALDRFSVAPDVSRAYTHGGRTWAPKADFPATFSQPFLFDLNSLNQFEEALYGEGGEHAHFEYTVTLDGTGKIPFELDVDGHTIKYVPGKPGIPTRLVWPPLTNSPTRLIAKTGAKGGLTLPAQNAGAWSLHHLLQAADDQNGNVFTFRTVGFAHSLVPLTNEKGTLGTLQIRVDSPAGSIFSRGYFAKLRCESTWALN